MRTANRNVATTAARAAAVREQHTDSRCSTPRCERTAAVAVAPLDGSRANAGWASPFCDDHHDESAQGLHVGLVAEPADLAALKARFGIGG